MSRLGMMIWRGVIALLAVTGMQAWAQSSPEVIREGMVVGSLGAVRTALQEVSGPKGMSFELKDFGDSSAALRALDQGELDIAITTTQHMARALAEGMDVVWVMGSGGGYNVLVAREGLGVEPNDLETLKQLVRTRKQAGKPIAIAVPTGSLQHAKLVTYLRQAGLDPDTDVRIVNVGFANHPRALQAGEVDIAMTLAPFGVLAMSTSGATLVEHLFDGPYGKQEVGFIVNRKLIESDPEKVQRIVDAHVAAMKKFVDNSDQQVAYEMKYSRFPEPIVDKTEREFIRYTWKTNIADLKLMATEMQALGWTRDDISAQIDKAVDLRFLAKATDAPVETLVEW